jgi:sigma-E factor negative regulatory protein RseB
VAATGESAVLARPPTHRPVFIRQRPTRIHRIGALALVIGTLAALAVLGAAGPAAAHGLVVGADDDRAAVRQLQRAVVAPDGVSFSGTRMVSAWEPDHAVTVMLDVHHVFGQGTTVRVRSGGDARSVMTFIRDHDGSSCCLQGLQSGALSLLVDNFSVTTSGSGRVAGRPAQIVAVGRGAEAAARLWVDRRTGLLLRSEIYGRDGRLARTSVYIDLRVERHAFLEHLPPMLAPPGAVAMSTDAIPRLEASGFRCPRELPEGFRLMDLDRTRDDLGTLHATYTDGLSTVSVFEQRGSLDTHSLTGFERHAVGGRDVYVRYGLPTYVSWAGQGTVFTVVTDAPADTIAQIISVYPLGQSDNDDGLWARLWRGLCRLVANASPLALRSG